MPQGRAPRLVAWSIVVYAAYLVVGNLLLNSALGADLANRKPDRLTVAWRYAWTLYPGHVHATGVELRGQVRRLAWQMEADSVDGRVALLPLFAREIRLPRLEIAGVDAGAQRRDPAVPAVKARPGGWLLRLDRVAARDVRSIAFDGFVLAGAGSAEMGVAKTLRGGPVEILPSQASFEQATLQHLDTPLAHDLGVDLRFAVARHLGSELPGLRKLEMSDLDITVRGRTVGIAIESDPGAKSFLRSMDDSGNIEGQIGWRHGRLVPGGMLRAWAPIREALPGMAPTTARATALLEVGDQNVRLHADLGGDSLAELRGNVDLRIDGHAIPVDDPTALLRRSSGRVVARWNFQSLAWLGNLLPPTHFVAFDGSGAVAADLEIGAGVIRPGSHLDIPTVDVAAHVMGNWFEGAASARLRFRDSSDGTPRVYVDALLKEFQVARRRSARGTVRARA